MTARKLNPEGTLLGFGPGVRLERGPHKPEPGSKVVWVLYKREDVKDDPDTTYTYRFEETARYDETEDGVPPEEALAAAEALAA